MRAAGPDSGVRTPSLIVFVDESTPGPVCIVFDPPVPELPAWVVPDPPVLLLHPAKTRPSTAAARATVLDLRICMCFLPFDCELVGCDRVSRDLAGGVRFGCRLIGCGAVGSGLVGCEVVGGEVVRGEVIGGELRGGAGR